MAEKLSVVMSRKHLEDADIALLVIDATEGVSSLDATIAGYAHESGRSMIILVNKWDLVTTGKNRAISQARAARIQDSKRPQDQKLYDRAAARLPKIPELCACAVHFGLYAAKNVDKIFPLIEEVAAERPQAHQHRRDESLPQDGRLRARLRSHAPASQNSLPDAIECGPAHLHFVHRPSREITLLLPALPGKPDPPRLRICGHADLDQEPGEGIAHVQDAGLASRNPLSDKEVSTGCSLGYAFTASPLGFDQRFVHWRRYAVAFRPQAFRCSCGPFRTCRPFY